MRLGSPKQQTLHLACQTLHAKGVFVTPTPKLGFRYTAYTVTCLVWGENYYYRSPRTFILGYPDISLSSLYTHYNPLFKGTKAPLNPKPLALNPKTLNPILLRLKVSEVEADGCVPLSQTRSLAWHLSWLRAKDLGLWPG